LSDYNHCLSGTDMNKNAIAIAAIAALVGTPAFAADMALKAPPPLTSATSWSGFYVGLNGGYGWGNQTVAFSPNDPIAYAFSCGGTGGSTCPPPAPVDSNGEFGGIQVGYNWQFSHVALAGVETDLDGAGIHGSGTSTFLMDPAAPPGTSDFVAQQDITWFGTVRGRLGWLPSDDLLLYATGGFAFAHVNENLSLNVNPALGGAGAGSFAFSCTFPGTNCFFGSTSRTVTGWTAGAGLEYALWNNVSLKAEYLFVSLGGAPVNVAANTATLNPAYMPSSFTAAFSRTDFQVVRAGLNIRFGGPMPAKY
jgi:outer membrane immunogenic protein